MNDRHSLRCALRSLLAVALCFLPCAVARAQSTTATLSGTIEDQNGAVVPGVDVVVENLSTTLRRQTKTDDSGTFTVPLLSPGHYRITARRDGFTAVQIHDVVLNVGDQKTIRIELRTGDIKETVVVEGGSPLINDSPAVGTIVDRQFVENLPLNGRSFQALIELTPGTVLTKPNGNEQGQFSVNGQRADTNYFLVDGVSANIGIDNRSGGLGQTGAGALPGLSTLGSTSNLVSVDALQEFKIASSTFAPEFGRTPGAQISIITRSGTNKFRGSLFEYFRNDAMDANDWFVNRAGLPKPATRQSDFGGVLGGPIIKNRTFFFFSYEGLRLRQPRVAITEVPPVSLRQAVPAPIQPLLNAFPLPNGPVAQNGLASFTAGFSDPSSLDATSIRIDHAVGSKFTLFGRFNFAPSMSDRRAVSSNISLNTIARTTLKTLTLTSGATWALMSTVNNEFRLNWSRNRGSTSILLDNFGGAVAPPDSFLFPSFATRQNAFYQLLLLVGSFPTIAVGKQGNNTQRQVNFVDNLEVASGRHQLKFGFDYRRLYPINDPYSYTLQPQFSSLAATLTGNASSVFVEGFSGSVFPIFNNFSAYGQDTWKLKERLTLTYGLRWDVNPAPHERNGNDPFAVSQVTDPSSMALAPRGTPLYRTTYGNFAPRIGVAYKLSQTPGKETILRGGFGVFNDLGNGVAANAFRFFPYDRSIRLSNVPFPLNPATIAVPPVILSPVNTTIFVLDPRIKLPRTYQWNAAIERSLGLNQTISASYVGAAGRSLLRQETLTSPNPIFTSNVFVTRNTATSDYNALQLQYNRRLTRGLQALASYTWSHSIDIASNDSSITNPPFGGSDPTLDRGPSDFDVRHSLVAAATYNIPSGHLGSIGNSALRNWSVDTIFRARTATPVNVFSSRLLIGTGSVQARPDLISGVPLYIQDSLAPGGRRINPAAFDRVTPNASKRQGTLGRNALRGFSINQIDLSLRRQFGLTETVKLQLRTDFFNILNHPNFGDPDGNLASITFGRSTSMQSRSLGSGGFNPLYQVGGPRSIQLAIKLLF